MTNEEKISDIKQRIKSLKSSMHKPIPSSSLRTITPFTIVVELFSGIAVLGFLGYIVDRYLDTMPIFSFVFAVCGMLGGVYNIYRDAKNLTDKDNKNA